MADEPAPTLDGVARLSIFINDETAQRLNELKARHSITTTEAVRLAVGLLHYLDGVQRAGMEIQVRDGRRANRVVVFD